MTPKIENEINPALTKLFEDLRTLAQKLNNPVLLAQIESVWQKAITDQNFNELVNKMPQGNDSPAALLEKLENLTFLFQQSLKM
jgi:hypothetical protein